MKELQATNMTNISYKKYLRTQNTIDFENKKTEKIFKKNNFSKIESNIQKNDSSTVCNIS